MTSNMLNISSAVATATRRPCPISARTSRTRWFYSPRIWVSISVFSFWSSNWTDWFYLQELLLKSTLCLVCDAVGRVIQTLTEGEPVFGVTSLENNLYVLRDKKLLESGHQISRLNPLNPQAAEFCPFENQSQPCIISQVSDLSTNTSHLHTGEADFDCRKRFFSSICVRCDEWQKGASGCRG